jgi:hypothetical protein
VQLDLTPEKAIRAATIVTRLKRAIARDVDVISSVVRVLENPKGPGRLHAERFREIIRDMVREPA